MNLNDFENSNKDLVEKHYWKHKAEELESQLKEAHEVMEGLIAPPDIAHEVKAYEAAIAYKQKWGVE